MTRKPITMTDEEFREVELSLRGTVNFECTICRAVPPGQMELQREVMALAHLPEDAGQARETGEQRTAVVAALLRCQKCRHLVMVNSLALATVLDRLGVTWDKGDVSSQI